jgi:hypothetical protein
MLGVQIFHRDAPCPAWKPLDLWAARALCGQLAEVGKRYPFSLQIRAVFVSALVSLTDGLRALLCAGKRRGIFMP